MLLNVEREAIEMKILEKYVSCVECNKVPVKKTFTNVQDIPLCASCRSKYLRLSTKQLREAKEVFDISV